MDILHKYFPDLTPKQITQFTALGPLYSEWNEQINVISRKDIGQLYERHILHGLGIAQVNSFTAGTRVLDVGTGGGFPGIPLAILFPEVGFVLVDSIGKKIKVVQAVVDALGLKNVTALHDRAENVPGKFDFVVSRAVTRLPVFVGWVSTKFLDPQKNVLLNGILYLKGGDLTEELAPFGARVEEIDLKDFYDEAFFETKKVVYLPMV